MDSPLFAALGVLAALIVLVLSLRYRTRLAKRISESSHPLVLWWLRDIVLGLAVIFLSTCALEVWNGGLASIEPRWVRIELVQVAALMIFAYAIAGRRSWLVVPLVVVMTVLGIAQHYVLIFRGLPLLPTDLHSIRTAEAVAAGYNFSQGIDVVARCVAFGVLALACALCVVRIPAARPAEGKHASGTQGTARYLSQGIVGWALTAFVAVASAAVGFYFATVDYEERFGYEANWWDISQTYAQAGTVPTLVNLVHSMEMNPPEGWDEQSAQDTLASLAAQYDKGHAADDDQQAETADDGERLPHVIVVMNETYADLTIYDRLGLPAEAKPFFLRQQVPGTVEAGITRMSVLGGNTCNSEYELLTGDSMLGVGAGKIIYTLYELSDVPSLAKQLGGLGYRSVAIHPHGGRNWNRQIRYEELGFDEFLNKENTWPEWEWDSDDPLGIGFHGEISDQASYDVLMDQLEAVDGTGQPQFLFDVTVQNHGGYDKQDIGEPDAVNYEMAGVSDGLESQLNEYLGCINNSSRMVQDLMVRLEGLDDDVILVFFGDHQPVLSKNVCSELYDDYDSQEILGLQYQTCYFIWRNHAAEREAAASGSATSNDIGVNYLAAHALEAAGLPLTDMQKAQLVLQEKLPAVCLMGAVDATGEWYAPDAAEVADGIDAILSLDWLTADRYLR